MLRTTPLISSEAYHIYNRGAGKQIIFTSPRDYHRFLVLLYLANSDEPIHLGNLHKKYKGPSSVEAFLEMKPGKGLVDVLAYALMPNHFHLVLRQKTDLGITTYMKKVCTAYAMYFNLNNERNGTLFQGRFKSNHLDTDRYFKWIFPYVHLNPLSIVSSEWQEKGITDSGHGQNFLRNYQYSSYYDYYVAERPERAILAYDEAKPLLDKEEDLQDMLAEFAKGRVMYADIETGN